MSKELYSVYNEATGTCIGLVDKYDSIYALIDQYLEPNYDGKFWISRYIMSDNYNVLGNCWEEDKNVYELEWVIDGVHYTTGDKTPSGEIVK